MRFVAWDVATEAGWKVLLFGNDKAGTALLRGLAVIAAISQTLPRLCLKEQEGRG